MPHQGKMPRAFCTLLMVERAYSRGADASSMISDTTDVNSRMGHNPHDMQRNNILMSHARYQRSVGLTSVIHTHYRQAHSQAKTSVRSAREVRARTQRAAISAAAAKDTPHTPESAPRSYPQKPQSWCPASAPSRAHAAGTRAGDPQRTAPAGQQ